MAQKQNAQNAQNIPEGTVLREDGCICPVEVKEVKCKCKLETCPYDPRFPNTNQTRRCFLRHTSGWYQSGGGTFRRGFGKLPAERFLPIAWLFSYSRAFPLPFIILCQQQNFFVDYQRCVRLLGDYPGCLYFLRCYRALCPMAWVEKWFEQLEKGTFPKKIYPAKPIIYPPKDICTIQFDDDQPGIPPSAC